MNKVRIVRQPLDDAFLWNMFYPVAATGVSQVLFGPVKVHRNMEDAFASLDITKQNSTALRDVNAYKQMSTMHEAPSTYTPTNFVQKLSFARNPEIIASSAKSRLPSLFPTTHLASQ
jgi:hypothetical protein